MTQENEVVQPITEQTEAPTEDIGAEEIVIEFFQGLPLY